MRCAKGRHRTSSFMHTSVGRLHGATGTAPQTESRLRVDATSGDLFSTDSHIAIACLAGPWLEAKPAGTCQLLTIDELLGGADHEHAPAGARRHVVSIDLERNGALQDCRDQLLTRRSAEHDVVIEQRIDDRQHERPVRAHADAPDPFGAQQRFALLALENPQSIATHIEKLRADLDGD